MLWSYMYLSWCWSVSRVWILSFSLSSDSSTALSLASRSLGFIFVNCFKREIYVLVSVLLVYQVNFSCFDILSSYCLKCSYHDEMLFLLKMSWGFPDDVMCYCYYLMTCCSSASLCSSWILFLFLCCRLQSAS